MDKTIMVVDDSKIAQLQLQRILSDSPYKVISCCQNGQEAVDQYPILKPEMDGLEAARKILTENPEAKILMISSLAYEETIQEATLLGAKGFIYKPFEADEVLKTLDSIFAE